MNGILLVDKPAGWTSHDVVAKLRGILRERRIGHSGTLDPMATGLLVVFVGKATKAVEFAEADRKRYIAGLRLGLVTDTQDTTGAALAEREASVSGGQLEEALASFRGEISQVPPMYSAVKVGGERLYKIARRGGEVERKARAVTIYKLECLGRDAGGDVLLDVECSKGTYVRTLCSDIGEKLGCGACMSSLRRVAAGAFSVDEAHTIEQIAGLAESGDAAGALLPVEAMFAQRDEFVLDARRERDCRCGRPFDADIPDGEYRVKSPAGEFLMLARAEGGHVSSIKNFF